jgi:hypothetical protein
MDDRTKRLMNDHIRSNDFYTLLPAVDLLNELVDYGKRGKAEIVYRKCLRAGKRNLAERIKRKYNLQEPHDDMITAFGFALACANGR